MAYGEIAKGLADLQISTLDGSNAPTTWVEVPGPRSLNFQTEAGTEELEGGNAIIAKYQTPQSLSGSMELGQINLAALAVLTGGTVSTTGVTPDEVTSLDQTDDPGVFYYRIAGQSPSTDAAGSAYRVIIMKALTTSGPDETLETGGWNTPTIDFEGLAVGGVLVTREQYETEVALPPA